MKRIFFSILFLAFVTCYSQDRALDSLMRVLSGSKEDTNKVYALNEFSWKVGKKGDLDSALKLCEKTIELAKKLKYHRGAAVACLNSGSFYSDKGYYEEALKKYSEGLKIAAEINDEKLIARFYNNIGVAYSYQGDYVKALDNHLLSVKIREERKYVKELGSSYTNIGIVYMYQNDHENAMKYFLKSKESYEERGDKYSIANCWCLIGNIHHQMNRSDKALECYRTALKIAEETGAKRIILQALDNIGVVNSAKGNHKEALKSHLLALKMAEEINSRQAILNVLINIASCYWEQKNLKEAEKFGLRALDLEKKVGELESARTINHLLYSIYTKSGEYQKALKHYEAHVMARDSLFNVENTKKIVKATMKAEQEKKDLLVAEEFKIKELQLSRTRYLMIAMGGLFFLLFIVAILLVRQNRLKANQRAMKLEQKLLRLQMNPHFIYNSLQAIQNYILKQNQKEAVKYLSSFAALTREVLESSRTESVPLSKELHLLEHYLELQKLRFGKRFDYSIRTDENINTEEILVPPMLAQPFIENALEHGMQDIEEGGQIDVSFSLNEGDLLMQIKDNGLGLRINKSSDKKHNSLAMAITLERIQVMNKDRTRKATFTISDAYPLAELRKGVKVCFSIPLFQ